VNFQTEWNECRIDDVMRYFAKGFELPKGREIYRTEFFIDTNQGKVVFKLTTKDKEKT